MKKSLIITGITIVLMLGVLGAGTLAAQDSQDALSVLAAKISEKRGRVETLSNDLDLLKADYNEDLRSQAAQRADVETQIKREELRIAQMKRDLEEYRSRMTGQKADLRGALPMTLKILDTLETRIKAGIPFQADSRIREVKTLRDLLAEGRLDSGSVLARVWNLLESEYRLTSESGLYRQRILLEGQEQLVEVARLGMVLLYFKTFDARYGVAVPGTLGWDFLLLKDTEDQKRVADLYEALRKNIKEGYFPLPNPQTLGADK